MGWTGSGWLTGGGARGFWLEALLIFLTQRIVGSDKRERKSKRASLSRSVAKV